MEESGDENGGRGDRCGRLSSAEGWHHLPGKKAHRLFDRLVRDAAEIESRRERVEIE